MSADVRKSIAHYLQVSFTLGDVSHVLIRLLEVGIYPRGEAINWHAEQPPQQYDMGEGLPSSVSLSYLNLT